MIIFTKLRYKNFLSSGNLWTEISLDTHKNTLIIGQNGAGKSTLIDALTFSLFGKPFRKITKGNVVNSINNKQCRVETEFTIGSKRYKIVRGIKPNLFEIYCNGALINQDASSRDYQDHLESNILNMNYKTFTQVVILGSASFTPFMNLSAADRRLVIENLLDIQIFSNMSAILKNKLQINKDAMSKNQILLDSKLDNQSYIEKTIETLRANNKERLNQLIADRDSKEKEMVTWSNLLTNYREELDELIENMADTSGLRKKHSELISLRATFQSKDLRCRKENEFLSNNETCPTCKQPIHEDFKKDKVNANQLKIHELWEATKKLDRQVDDIVQTLNNLEETVSQVTKTKQLVAAAKSNYDAYKRMYQMLEEEIASFSENDTALRDSEAELRAIVLEVSTLQKEKETLLDERKYIDVATTLLKDGGIKATIVKKYLPVINKSINNHLSKLGLFVSFNLDENFEETIKSRHRDEYTYNNFSEGEKLRIDLAILLTWRLVAKQKNSVSCNLLIFDEILDRAMDDMGIDEFIQIMWKLGHDGANIFVISHRDSMTEKFQRIISFKKIKNFSIMETE